MSKQVDNYVASMEFDNSKFEKNVATSMSTLEKLKQKLNFSGASKGLEEINAAAGKVNMSGLGSGVDAVKAKFSALDVVAVTALANITNKAVDAGEKLVKSLSVDQISSGWNKYAQKTTSVQTLVNSTGKSLDEINGYLEKLMWYSDETSYGFTDMTSALATMTSSGGDIEKLIPMIEGVANATAFAGKGASEFSTVMKYGINQAYSMGYMLTKDWMSIENATVNSKQLIQALIAAGEEIGTIEKGAVTLENFRTSLADKWLTTEVMETGFGQFSKVTEEIYEGIESGIFKNYADGLEQIGDKYGEVALRAAASSQEAKTFTEAIDATKDAVSSGWMNTFELIFGDYEKAKVLWTDLAETLYEVFAAGGEIRNWILEIALNFTKPWNKIMEKLEGSGIGKVRELAENFENITGSIKTAAEKLEYFQDIVNKVWRGDYNNVGDNPDRFDLLEKAGYNAEVVQELVNKGYQYELTIEDVEAAHKKFGLTLETTTEETKKTVDATNKATSAFENLSDEQLKQAGLTEEEIALYKAMQKEADRLGISVSELAEEMSTNDGRTLLIDSFKNLGSILLDIGNIAKEAWKAIFNPPGAEEIAVKLYGAIKSLNEFTESLRLTNKETGELTAAGENIQRTFKGVFAVVNILTDIIGGALSTAFEILSEVFGSTNVGILDVTASVGDALVVFKTWLDENQIITKGFKKLGSAIKAVIKIIKKWIDAFKQIPFVSDLLKDLKSLFADIQDGAEDGTNVIEKWVGSFDGLSGVNKILDKISEAFEWVGDIVEGSITAFGEWFEVFKETEGVQHLIEGVTDLIDAFSKLFSGELDAEGFASALGKSLGEITASIPEMAIQIGKDFIAGFSNGLSKGIGEVISGILEFCGNFISAFMEGLGEHSPSVIAEEAGVNWVQGFINGILSMLKPLKNAVQPIIDFITSVFKSFWGYITDENGEIEWDKIFAGAITIESLAIALKFADAFQTLANAMSSFSGIFSGVKSVLSSLSKTITEVGKAVKWDLAANAVLKMAIAVGILAVAIWALTKIDDIGKLWNAVGVIIVLAAVVAGLAWVMSKLGEASISFSAAEKKLDVNGMKTTILQLGVALLLLAAAVKIIGTMEPDEAKQGLISLAAMIGGIIVFMAAMGAVSLYAKDVANFGKMMTKMAIAMLLMVVVIKMVGKLDSLTIEKGLAFMGAFAIFTVALGLVASLCGEHVSKFGTMMIKLAVAMGLMVIVCKLVNKLTAEEALKGAAFAAAFVIFIKALVKVTTIGNKQKLAEVGGVILAAGVAILLMAAACKIVSSLSWGEIAKGLACVVAFGLVLAALIALLKIGNKQQMGKVAGSLIGASVAILIMAGTAVILSMIPLEDLWKGVAIVAAFGLIVAAMVKSLKGANDAQKSIKAMAVCIALMAAAVVALSFLNEGDLIRCTAAMAVLMGMFTLMVNSLKGLKKGKVDTGALAVLAGVVLILGGIVVMLSYLVKDPSSAINSVIALSALLVATTFMLKVLHKVGYSKKDISKIWNLTAMAVPLLAFAAIIGGLSIALSATNSSVTTSTIIGLIAVMGAMVGLLAVIHKIKYSKNDLSKIWNLTAMAVPLLAFAAIIGGLSIALSATNSSVTASTIIGLIAVMGAMVGLLAILNKIKINKNKITKSIIALTAMAVPLGAFAFILSKMGNVQNAVTNAIVLAALAAACTLLLVPLTLIGSFGKSGEPYLGVLALLAMAVPLVAFAGILMLMDNVQNAVTNAIVLTALATACTLLLIPLTLIGAAGIAGLPFIGVLALLAMAVPLVAFAGILMLMDNVKNAEANAKALIGLVTACSLMLIPLTLVGLGGPAALIGVGSLLALIIAIGVLAVGIGALMEKFPNIQRFLDSGLPVLEQLAESIGTMVGKLISGFSDAVGEGLVRLGENISDFMTSLEEASGSASAIKAGSFEGVRDLMDLMVEIGGSTVLTSIADVFTLGGTSMEKFVTDAKTFFEGMKEAMSPLDGVTFNEQGLDCILKFATKLTSITGEIGDTTVWSSVTDFFTLGGTSMEKFGKDAKEFFSGMKTAMFELDGVTFNEEGLNCVMDFAERLAAFESSLDGMYSFIAWVTGRSDLDIFRQNTKQFFNSMKTAMFELDGVTFNEEGLNCVMDFAERLAAFESSLDGMYSFIAWVTGRSDLDIFRQNAKQFFNSMKETMQSLDGVTFNEESLNYLMDFAERIAALQSSLDGMYGFMSWCTGLTDLDMFRINAKQFFNSMKDMMSSLDDIYFNVESLNYLMDFAERIAALQSSLEGMRSFMTWCTGLTDISVFGANAKLFMNAMKDAMSSLDGVTFNEEGLNSVMAAAERLAEFQNTLEPMGGVMDWFNGRDDIGAFGSKVGEFATAMSKLKEGMGESGISEAVVTSVINAGNAIIELQKALPEEGWFDGKMNLSEFSGYVEDFATAMSTFSTKATEIDSGAVSTCLNTAYKIKNLITSLADLDTSGVETFTGIGSGWPGADGPAYDIARAIAKFGDTVADIDPEKVTVAVTEANRLKRLIASLVGLDTSGVENFKPEDIGSAMSDYADEVDGINTDIVSSSITSANRLKSFIAGLVGLDSSGISNFKPGSIGTALSTYSTNVAGFNSETVAASITSARQLKSFIADLAGLDTSGVSAFKTAINELSTVNVAAVVKAFSGASGKMSSAGADMINGLVKGMQNKLSSVNSTASKIASSVSDAVKKKGSAFNTAGKTLATKLVNGFKSGKSNLKKAASSAAEDAKNSIRDKYDSFYNAGSYLVDGFKNGISENSYKAAAKAKAMAEAAEKAARDALKINSPSKVFKYIGNSLPEGMTAGIKENTDEAVQATVDMTEAVKTAGVDTIDVATTDMKTTAEYSLNNMLSDYDLGEIDSEGLDGLTNLIEEYGSKSGLTFGEILSNLKSQGGDVLNDLFGNYDLGSLNFESLGLEKLNLLLTGLSSNSNIEFGFGDTGEEIKVIQQSLEELGHSVGECGIDGIIGPDTTAAIKEFQEMAGLEVTGIVDQETLNSLQTLCSELNNVSDSVETAEMAVRESSDKINGDIVSIPGKLADEFATADNEGSKMAKRVINDIVNPLTDSKNLDLMSESGQGLANEAEDGFNLLDWFKTGKTSASNLVEGYISKIKSSYGESYNVSFGLSKAGINGLNDGQDSHSPSREAMKSGKWLGEGLIIGIKCMGQSVYNASENMGQTAVNATRSAMTTVLEALNSDMDAQPTIRPVVDLSDVKTGVNAISSMLAGTHNIGVQSNLNAINVAMNRKLQNGSNDDIISAINKLNEGLDGNRGDTYNFAGITYDNGDEISEAVQTLVRAAKMGRRV